MQYLKLLRPFSWIKNFFVLVPIFFAKAFFDYAKLEHTVWAFIVFCLSASAVYIVNDLVDRQSDGKHPSKKNRPLASGKVSVKSASLILAVLVAAVILILIFLVPAIWPYISLYVILNVLYSFWLKHIAAVDILMVSGFYLLRILVGGAAAQVLVSHWLILCTIFISLFLIVGKRKAEYALEHRRQVLDSYHDLVLDGLLIMAATLSVISYSLYTVLVLDSNLAIYSVFFVLLGIIRYLLIIHKSNKSEYPELALMTDPVIITSIGFWIILMFVIFYHFTF